MEAETVMNILEIKKDLKKLSATDTMQSLAALLQQQVFTTVASIELLKMFADKIRRETLEKLKAELILMCEEI